MTDDRLDHTLAFVPGCADCATPHLLTPDFEPLRRLVRVRAPKVPTMRGALYRNGKYVGHFRQVPEPEEPNR